MNLLQNIFNDLEESVSLAKCYILDPDDYVRIHSVKINGKLRTLRAYKESPKGAALRALHEKIADFLSSCYTPAESSFAYKKGSDIFSCINCHKNASTFLKSDIRSLKSKGDSFHALGLNLVFVDKNQNRITVSDSYLRETCKQIMEYAHNKSIEKEVIAGKINFIYNASQGSYKKFKKLVKIKLGKELEEIL